jgi:kynurenine formamidase
MRRFPDGHVVTAAEIQAELQRIGHTLKPLEIVLFNTSAPAAWGKPEYYSAGCGFGREATLWLAEQGIRVVGTDALGWDAPFEYVVERFRETNDPSIIWEGHKAGREIGYYQMEKMWNLDQLPNDGFTVACFPIKLKGCSAGWTRPVALISD